VSLVGKIRVTCPACGAAHECELVQSINTERAPALRERLLRGELNVMTCACGKRAQLAGNLLFHDPVAQFYCQVAPGPSERAQPSAGSARGRERTNDNVTAATAAFRTSGASGTLRIVPSQNALVEKVKILDAGLDDWAIELVKVMLLASLDIADLDRVVLFERADADQLHWVMLSPEPVGFSSPRAAYDNLRRDRAAAKPGPDELQIDRPWAVEALRKILREPN